MKKEDKTVNAAGTGVTIGTDVAVLRTVARKILTNLDNGAENIDFFDKARKISLVKELMTLTELLLKLERVQKDLDLGLGDMLDASGSVFSPAEMTLIESFLSKAAKNAAPDNS